MKLLLNSGMKWIAFRNRREEGRKEEERRKGRKEEKKRRQRKKKVNRTLLFMALIICKSKLCSCSVVSELFDPMDYNLRAL